MKLIGELNKVDLAFYQLVIISQWDRRCCTSGKMD